MSIGEQIKKRRKELGMSAEDLGKATGRSRATIYRLENGDTSSFTMETLNAISNALGVDKSYFFADDSIEDFVAKSEITGKYYSQIFSETLKKQDELFEKFGALMSTLDTLSEDDLKEVENFIKFKTSQSDE